MIRFTLTHPEDVWTRNGAQLDRITLVRGLPDAKAMISQETNANKQVPAFRVDRTAHDIMSMVEVSYRVPGVTVKLYVMKLESVAGPYFETVDPKFDQLIASAQLRK